MSQANTGEILKNMLSIETSVKHAHTESDKLGKSWSILSTVLNTASVGVGAWVLSLTGVGRNVKSIVHELTTLSSMKGPIDIESLKDQLAQYSLVLEATSQQTDATDRAAHKEAEQAAARLGAEIKLGTIRNEMFEHYAALGSANLKWLTLGGVLMASTVASARDYNQALKQANPDLLNRWHLLREMFSMQVRTGASAHEAAEVARALTHYGLDLKQGFGDAAVLVQQMQAGLGIGAEQGAELVSAFQHLNVDARGVADSIARVAADTALSAQEATGYAIAIARALGTLRQGAGSGATEVSQVLNRLEGQLKAATGISGELTGMYARMTTTLEGAGVAHMLGIGNIESLGQGEGAEALKNALGNFVNRQLKGLTGDARIAQLTQLSEITHLSATTLSALNEAMEKTSQTTGAARTIQEAWADQMATTGTSFGNLLRSLQALAQSGLTPFLWVLGGAARFVSFLGSVLAKIPGVITVVSWGLTGLAGYLIPALIRQLSFLAVTMVLLAKKAREAAIAQLGAAGVQLGGTTATTTGQAVKGLLSQFPKLSTALSGLTGIVSLATLGYGALIAAGIAAAYGLYKLKENADNVQDSYNRIWESFSPKIENARFGKTSDNSNEELYRQALTGFASLAKSGKGDGQDVVKAMMGLGYRYGLTDEQSSATIDLAAKSALDEGAKRRFAGAQLSQRAGEQNKGYDKERADKELSIYKQIHSVLENIHVESKTTRLNAEKVAQEQNLNYMINPAPGMYGGRIPTFSH